MAQAMFGQASEKITGTAQKAYRTASAVADAVESGARAARRSGKQVGEAAEVLFHTTKRRMMRHPIEAALTALAAGIAAGTTLVWMVRRK